MLTRNNNNECFDDNISLEDISQILDNAGYTPVKNEDLALIQTALQQKDQQKKTKTHNPIKRVKNKYDSLDKKGKKKVKIGLAVGGGVAAIATTAAIIHHHNSHDDNSCSGYTDNSFNY